MIKSVYLVRRNPASTFDEFLRNWRKHAALSATFPEVGKHFTSVVQCGRVQGVAAPGLSQEYDGANILGLVELLGAVEVNHAEGMDALREDELRVFARPVAASSITVYESVLRDGPPRGFVLLEFVRRSEGVGRAEFVEAWSGAYARELAGMGDLDGAVRWVHDYVLLPPPPGLAVDGVAETWFESLEQARAFVERAPWEGRTAGFSCPVRVLMQVNHAWFR